MGKRVGHQEGVGQVDLVRGMAWSDHSDLQRRAGSTFLALLLRTPRSGREATSSVSARFGDGAGARRARFSTGLRDSRGTYLPAGSRSDEMESFRSSPGSAQ